MAQVFQVTRQSSRNNQSGKEIAWYDVVYVDAKGNIKTQSFQSDPNNQNRVLSEEESQAVAKQWARDNAPDVEGFKVGSAFDPKTSRDTLFQTLVPNLVTRKWEPVGGPVATSDQARSAGVNAVNSPPASGSSTNASSANAAESRLPSSPPPLTASSAPGLPSVDFLAHALLDGSGGENFAGENAAKAKAGDPTAIAVQNRALQIATERGFFGGKKTDTPSTPAAPGAPTGGTPTPPAGGTPTSGLPEAPIAIDPTKLDSDEMYNLVKAGYGWAAMYLKDKELGPLIRRAAAEGWGKDEIAGAVQNTKWWQNTNETARNFDIDKAKDPATQATLVSRRMQDINSAALQMGLNIAGIVDLGEFGRYNKSYYMAVQSLREAWTKDQINTALFEEGGFDPTKAQKAGAVKQQAYTLKALSAEYMLPMSDETANRYSQDMITGKMTEDTFKAILTDQAKMRFPTLAPLIDRGATPWKFFDSYRTAVANTLEMDANQVDFMDPHFSEVLDYKDPSTGQSRFMTLTEAVSWAKSRSGWDFTQQAADAAQRASKGLFWSFDNVNSSSGSSGSSVSPDYSKPWN